MNERAVKFRRCAVYTRKSSEEGLEQEFNSLHAQREACEAFIKSQQSEGWQLVTMAYDDGGFSGGSMERPALKRLLGDIEAGLVDVVVVYKVDRLTRALADFAKMVEVFDARGISFVAVTQQFNTTTSMGRLTLNVLLSFAQFERELTGERIRDKIAASKRKGKWMGGCAPLGYDIRERRLVVNPEEAETVRFIFARFHELGSVRLLKQELDRAGLYSKVRVRSDGSRAGGCRFSRGALYKLLANPVYIGKVPHYAESYPGEHAPIIEHDLWEAVRQRLNQKSVRKPGSMVKPRVLVGKLFDEQGEALTATHALNHGRRYDYYISRKKDDGNTRNWRLPAREIEATVASAARKMFGDDAAVATALENAGIKLSEIAAALKTARGSSAQRTSSEILGELVERVDLQDSRMKISIRLSSLLARERNEFASLGLTRHFSLQMRHRGNGFRLKLEGSPGECRTDDGLVKVLGRSRAWFEELASGRISSVSAIATESGFSRRYIRRLLPLAFLAPRLVESIAAGTQPPELTTERLTTTRNLPLLWSSQASALGFDERAL